MQCMCYFRLAAPGSLFHSAAPCQSDSRCTSCCHCFEHTCRPHRQCTWKMQSPGRWTGPLRTPYNWCIVQSCSYSDQRRRPRTLWPTHLLSNCPSARACGAHGGSSWSTRPLPGRCAVSCRPGSRYSSCRERSSLDRSTCPPHRLSNPTPRTPSASPRIYRRHSSYTREPWVATTSLPGSPGSWNSRWLQSQLRHIDQVRSYFLHSEPTHAHKHTHGA